MALLTETDRLDFWYCIRGQHQGNMSTVVRTYFLCGMRYIDKSGHVCTVRQRWGRTMGRRTSPIWPSSLRKQSIEDWETWRHLNARDVTYRQRDIDCGLQQGLSEDAVDTEILAPGHPILAYLTRCRMQCALINITHHT